MKLTEQQKNRVEDLLSRMTLEEKIGQMNLESPSIVGGFDVPFEELIEMMTDGRISQEEFQKIMSTATRDFHEEDIRAGLVGAMMGDDPVKANELQKIAVEESRLGIPLIMGFDVIHGLRTVYPIAIAEAGTFDEELFERTAGIAAKESRAHGIGWNFAPMIDVARDCRWGRVSEGPGEDAYLASRFARAKIRGLQNDRTSSENYVAACLKHYVAYSACESGRDYNTTSMSISQLHNVYLPPFKAAVEEGAASAMASFNDLNGVPCTVNPYTLRELLKGAYGMDGFVVSDANGIKECVTHGIAEDDRDAGIQSANAGLDMDMGTHIYKDYLKEAVESGAVSMEVLDDAARRILSVKMWLGLFENPYVSEEAIARYAGRIPAEHAETALEAAKKSIVLLKNEGNVLPLSKKQKISLVGTLAAKEEEVIGAWAMSWKNEDCVSILDGLKNCGADVTYYPCGGPEDEVDPDEIKKACEEGDVVVAVAGELVNMSGEASSKANVELPGKQKKMLSLLLEQTAAAGKQLVTVLMNGRPLALGWEAEHLPVLVEAWHLGVQMGNAVAAVLTGGKDQEIQLVKSLGALWASDTPETDVPVNACVVHDKKTGKFFVFMTTDTTKTARQIVQTYELRPEIEEDFRQMKDFWKLSGFKSTKYNYITFHIVMTLTGYLFFQIYKSLEEGQAYTGRSLPVVAKNYKETKPKEVVVYVGQYFGIFPFLEFLKIYAECTLEVRQLLDPVLAKV